MMINPTSSSCRLRDSSWMQKSPGPPSVDERKMEYQVPTWTTEMHKISVNYPNNQIPGAHLVNGDAQQNNQLTTNPVTTNNYPTIAKQQLKITTVSNRF